ncbi:Fibrillin-1 [Stylophora pistillata]|uniref:Fibrillin-1 n=1 Tax=Stylophora pistillata TaxID=50429 RepID=A0A2B4RB39_STYPI|nr:Fibrillin-1 [Stylophora pistillata]
MGSFDDAETCELVGSFLQSQLQHLNINVGLYRDDRLAIKTSTSAPKISTIVARTTPLVLIARDRSTAPVILLSEAMDITAQRSTGSRATQACKRASDLVSDIDECPQNIHNCSNITATCSNTVGAFKCVCKPGFTGDGHNCTDIDECSQNSHNCSYKTATCNNSEGSFKCICKPDSVVMDTTALVPYGDALSYQREKSMELAETKAT